MSEKHEEGALVWISKWALSEGIKTGTFVRMSNFGMFEIIPDGEQRVRYFWLKEFHTSEALAIADANARRDRRTKSLRNQIAKLEALKFERSGS